MTQKYKTTFAITSFYEWSMIINILIFTCRKRWLRIKVLCNHFSGEIQSFCSNILCLWLRGHICHNRLFCCWHQFFAGGNELSRRSTKYESPQPSWWFSSSSQWCWTQWPIWGQGTLFPSSMLCRYAACQKLLEPLLTRELFQPGQANAGQSLAQP